MIIPITTITKGELSDKEVNYLYNEMWDTKTAEDFAIGESIYMSCIQLAMTAKNFVNLNKLVKGYFTYDRNFPKMDQLILTCCVHGSAEVLTWLFKHLHYGSMDENFSTTVGEIRNMLDFNDYFDSCEKKIEMLDMFKGFMDDDVIEDIGGVNGVVNQNGDLIKVYGVYDNMESLREHYENDGIPQIVLDYLLTNPTPNSTE